MSSTLASKIKNVSLKFESFAKVNTVKVTFDAPSKKCMFHMQRINGKWQQSTDVFVIHRDLTREVLNSEFKATREMLAGVYQQIDLDSLDGKFNEFIRQQQAYALRKRERERKEAATIIRAIIAEDGTPVLAAEVAQMPDATLLKLFERIQKQVILT